jgi:hypothetical protein
MSIFYFTKFQSVKNYEFEEKKYFGRRHNNSGLVFRLFIFNTKVTTKAQPYEKNDDFIFCLVWYAQQQNTYNV